MENVLHQRRSDFRNAERDRRVLFCDHRFVDPRDHLGARLGSATKEYNKLYVEDTRSDGILTVTGRVLDSATIVQIPTCGSAPGSATKEYNKPMPKTPP
jgi:hypothetical protein